MVKTHKLKKTNSKKKMLGKSKSGTKTRGKSRMNSRVKSKLNKKKMIGGVNTDSMSFYHIYEELSKNLPNFTPGQNDNSNSNIYTGLEQLINYMKTKQETLNSVQIIQINEIIRLLNNNKIPQLNMYYTQLLPYKFDDLQRTYGETNLPEECANNEVEEVNNLTGESKCVKKPEK